jgi:hypothetical protein
MYVIGTIREFHTDNFDVIIDAIEEQDADLSWDDTGDTARRIDDGSLILFCARARVLFTGDDGENIKLASDYLGNCVYESLEAFADHRECARYTRELRAKGDDAICGSYFSDMVSNVCKEARREIVRLAERLDTVNVRLT